MFKNLRKIVLGLLAVCLTGALGAGVAFGVKAHAEGAVVSVKAFKSTQINLNESITVRYNLTVPAGYTGAEMTFPVGFRLADNRRAENRLKGRAGYNLRTQKHRSAKYGGQNNRNRYVHRQKRRNGR